LGAQRTSPFECGPPLDNAKKRADRLRAQGKPFVFEELLRVEPDKGVTTIRNIQDEVGRGNPHWRAYLGLSNRRLAPFTSFSEPDQDDQRTGKPVGFALSQDQPLAFLAGL
jgi:putative SOS response-associated peptidase YedK